MQEFNEMQTVLQTILADAVTVEDEQDFRVGETRGGVLLNGWYRSKDYCSLYMHFVKGQLHSSDDLPAICNGSSYSWYSCGVVHRETGPALMGKDFKWNAWCWRGRSMLFPEWLADAEITIEDKVMLKLRWA